MKHILPENRPRERLMHSPSSLSSAELLAIILKSGTQKENVLEISHKLLQKYGHRLQYCSVKELSQEHGIGTAKACQIIAIFELYKRLPKENIQKSVEKAEDIVAIYGKRFQTNRKEHFVAVYLDVKGKIITDEIITIGLINASLVHPREVFNGAIKNMAYSLIVLHNHPSGDPTPSQEDIEISEKLSESGQILGIHFLDHVILGQNSYWSWNENRQKI